MSEFEWVSVRKYEDSPVENDYLLLVKFRPTGWLSKLRRETSKLRMYIGKANSWQKYPSMRMLNESDPTPRELNKMFVAAKIDML